MIELRTLGALSLRGADGHELDALLAHPKRAGLLAYLLVARPRGFHRRDALLALFWPELDQDRARTALRKAVYQIRRALGDDIIIGRGDEELRIADHLVWCDARALDEALDAGDAEGAIALYQGRFLDAFFVPEALGFERWMDEERSRLHDRAFDATWRLALRDEQAGNAFGATFWARRASALAPNDERALRRLIELLDRQGDRAGAVHAYEEFARRLAADYEVEPSAETQALMRQVRSRPAAAVPEERDEAVPQPAPRVANATSANETVPPAATHGAPLTRPPQPRRALGSRAFVAGAVLLVLVAAVAAVAWRRPQPSETALPDVVAVFPFAVRGDAAVSYLGDGMASLLALGLDGAGELRSVDPQAVLGIAERDSAAPADPRVARSLAGSLGAGRWVVGSVVEANRRLRINAALYDARRPGRPEVLATVEGVADSVFPLVDRLAAQLLAGPRSEASPSISRLAALTTHSLPALKAYLEGERSFRRGAFREAIAGFQEAVSLDSNFALAHYRLASAYSWSGNDSASMVAARAVKLGSRLAPPTRQLLEAFHLYIQGEADSAERRYREILSRRPEDVEALFQLGEVLFHENPQRGRPMREGEPYFRRAFAYNAGDAPLIHLLEIAALERDYATFDSLVSQVQSGSHFWLASRMVGAFVGSGEAERAAVESEIRQAREADIAQIASHAMFLVDDARAASRVVSLLDEAGHPDELRLVGRLFQAHIAMAAGRWRDAGRALDSAAAIDPLRAAEHASLLHALPLLAIPTARLEQVRATLDRLRPPARPPAPGILRTGDEDLHAQILTYARALMDARLGRLDEAARLAEHLVAEPAAAAPSLPVSWRAGARGQSLLAGGKFADGLAALATIPTVRRPVDLLGYSPFGDLRHERFLRGEALMRLGRLDEADRWFSSFAEHSPYGRLYLAPAHLRRAEVAERQGRKAEAARHYAIFATLWAEADPELRPVVDQARRNVAALAGR